ncbi:MAG: aminotransferase class V-fold PLP-dependent enzyme, partial [Actinomycetota bacterium]|nr:aminotransferase class V-fold PLP-dependent enzyme [Actinomycetota bacterium]
HMISRVTKEGSKWADPPAKFEAGTSPIAEAVGLGAAVDFLDEVGPEALWEHNRDIAAYAIERLSEVPGLEIHGPRDERVALVSFALEGIHPHDVAEILGRDNICVRAGHHCAQVLMDRLEIAATARASFGVYTTTEEIDRLVDGLEDARKVFGL